MKGKVAIDLTGRRFGTWTVLERAENKDGAVMWKCRCDCGTVKDVRATTLKNGSSTGCMKCIWKTKEHPRLKFNDDPLHRWRGNTNSIAYQRWSSMCSRCHDPNNKSYKHYGGRGIKVCDEWRHNFKAYYSYVSALEHYGEPGYSLDRIDNNGDYKPGNVRYATKSEQERNKRPYLRGRAATKAKQARSE